MVLRFQMQHDEAAGLQNDKILPGRESKMAAAVENSLTTKINFSPEPLDIFGWNSV